MYFLQRVERLLDMPPAEKDAVLRELGSHYDEIRLQLASEGMDEGQAAAKAEARLGDSKEVALTLNREHCVSSWKTAILTALPFLTGIIYHYCYNTPMTAQSLTAILLLAAVFVSGSIRELVRGRRPLWLSSWLAAGYVFGLAAFNAILLAVVPRSELFRYFSLILAIQFGIPLAIAVAGCWRMTSLWKFLIPTAAIAIGCSCAVYILLSPIAKGLNVTFYNPAIVVMQTALSVAHYALYLGFAIGAFQLHRYGGASHATLFIFALYWLSGGVALAGFYLPTPVILPRALLYTLQVPAGMTLAFLATLAFARASTPRKKRRILAWCAAIWGALIGNLIGFYIPALILLAVPAAIYERDRRREMQRIASELGGGTTA